MIYELAVVAKSELGDKDITSLTSMINDVIKEKGGEIVIQDDWGTRRLAQPFSGGVKKGHFLYFIYKSIQDCNSELTRRLGNEDSVLRTMVVRLGEEKEIDKIVKSYKTPFSKKYHGSVTDSAEEEMADLEGGGGENRKRFGKRRGCWFTANKCHADCKDPASFIWLLNEFGKISPARISGITRRHQNFANQAIKRARQLGISSHLSNRVLE